MLGSLVVLFFAVVMCVLIGVGIEIGLVACGLAAILVGLGVISSSFVVGLWSGRFFSAERPGHRFVTDFNWLDGRL